MSVTFLVDAGAAGTDRRRSTVAGSAAAVPNHNGGRVGPACRRAPVLLRSVQGGERRIRVGTVLVLVWLSACSGTGTQVIDSDREY